MKLAIGCFSGNFPGVSVTALISTVWLMNFAAADESQRSAQVSTAPEAPAALDQAALEERRAITQEIAKLAKSGLSPEQISAWHEKNAARLEANVQKLAAISARQNSVPRPYIQEVQIPAGASEALETFLMERAKLNNEQVRIHNQTLKAPPKEREQALEDWQNQNVAALEAQADRAAQVSAETPPPTLRVPTAADIPRNATPELRDFLTQRNTIIQAEADVTARLKTATPEERQHALEAWRATNPLPVRAMQQAADRLADESK